MPDIYPTCFDEAVRLLSSAFKLQTGGIGTKRALELGQTHRDRHSALWVFRVRHGKSWNWRAVLSQQLGAANGQYRFEKAVLVLPDQPELIVWVYPVR